MLGRPVRREDPVVYRVYEPDNNELQDLYKKVNYLKILEQEAQRKMREIRKKKAVEDAEKNRLEEKNREREIRREMGELDGDSDDEMRDDGVDPEEALRSRPKVRERYKLAVE
ncbi:unnamed protein product, partial [Amoebophrya sp. A25]|eukprot:GSA25T00025740001.1